MKNLKCTTISATTVLLLSLFNTGCGGGGGSDDAPVAQSTPAPQSTAITVKTSDLIADEAFLFESTDSLIVDVNIESLAYIRAYINVCYGDKNLKIDYANCVVNAPLKNGKMQSKIKLANDVDRLYMAIWQYSIDEAPLTKVWQRVDGMDWYVTQ